MRILFVFPQNFGKNWNVCENETFHLKKNPAQMIEKSAVKLNESGKKLRLLIKAENINENWSQVLFLINVNAVTV